MDKTDRMLNEQVAKNNTPAVHYILFTKDSIIKTFSHGLIDIAGNKEVTGNTTYHAFSVTKTFTALAILQLAEQKKINTEDRINKCLPDFPYPSEITIHQLLSHSAGIPNPIPLSWIHLVNEDASFDSKQFFRNIFAKNSKLKSKPNDTFAYSNPGYVLLGQLIEVITGTSFEEYIIHHIIEKIGLNKSQLGFKIENDSVHAKG